MARRTLTVAAAVLLLVPAALLRADDAPKGDKDLDGEWEGISYITDGQERLTAPTDSKPVYVFKGTSLNMTYGFSAKDRTIKVDASVTPKTIDITRDGPMAKAGPVLGVYEVKGDDLRICTANPGKDRPTELSAKQDSGWTLITFKRVKK